MGELELNNYLCVLDGFADIEFIEREIEDVTGRLIIKFCGDVGSIDKGEIELSFYGVEVMHLPFRFIPNYEFSQADHALTEYISPSEIESNCHLYTIKDDVKTWWVYARGYEVKVLPVFYGK